MKNYFITICIGLIGLSACTQEEFIETPLNEQQQLVQTRSTDSTLNPDSTITPLEVDSAMLEAFKAKMAKANLLASSTNVDENFSTNIYNIRDMPFLLKARGTGNKDGVYLTTYGPGKEIELTNTLTMESQLWYYLKVLPATAGVPYVIYSQKTGTPLTVGQYSNNPNNKILFAANDDSGSLMAKGWDLIPSQYYPGYFAIESCSYLGQSDPNNMWSVFNYVLEVKDNNKIGYAQYTKRPQQEFLLSLPGDFWVDEVTFIEGTENIQEGTPIKIKSEAMNTSVDPQPFSINVKEMSAETSKFYSNRSNIDFQIDNQRGPNKFQRPSVLADKILWPQSGTKYDAIYESNSIQNIPKELKFTIDGYAPENCRIEATSWVTTYNVSVNYKAKARFYYKGTPREIFFTGVWRGTIIADPKFKKPISTFIFSDLQTGEQITNYSAKASKTSKK